MECGDRSVAFIEEHRITNPWSSRKLLKNFHKSKPKQKGNRDVYELLLWIMLSQTHAFSLSSSVVHFRRQRSGDQNDHERQTSNDEIRVQTHRVAFVFVLIRSISTPKIQIEQVLTKKKKQMADMLTNGSFTRDEWDHLLRLFNFMNFSMFLAAIFFGTQSRVSCRRDLKKDRRRTTCVKEKSEASMFGIKKPLERRANHFHRFGCFVRPGNQELGQNSDSGSTKPNNAFSRVTRR